MTMKEAIRISREVKEENGEAEEWLRHKCNWEAMSRTAVIFGWGDPRDVVRRLAEEEMENSS